MNLAKHPLYMRHYHIMRRCYDDSFRDYPLAGGRGLRVYEPWHNLDTFIEDIVGTYGLPTGAWAQLSRKDPNVGWFPENIEGWRDHKYVHTHRKDNLSVTYQGRTQALSAWAKELGLNFSTIWNRIERGYTPEEAFNKPINKGLTREQYHNRSN